LLGATKLLAFVKYFLYSVALENWTATASGGFRLGLGEQPPPPSFTLGQPISPLKRTCISL